MSATNLKQAIHYHHQTERIINCLHGHSIVTSQSTNYINLKVAYFPKIYYCVSLQECSIKWHKCHTNFTSSHVL